MSEQKKIALFVDFDNIYLGLRETSREAAEAFATRPHVWLRWIEHGMPLEPRPEHPGPKENRVLIRQCYLNPDTFGKYRGYFTRSGFSVIDCPSLTSRGKNSGDIVMVMDILDALRHETHFDRFVIMSADADFTPVLQRLRAHDRRTAVLVSGQAAPAYRAACDRLITEDAFIELALEIAPTPEPQRALPPSSATAPAPAAVAAVRDPALLTAMGHRIYEEASSSGTLSASELPRILREFKEFTPTSNWLGYYSLQSLTEAILAHRNDLRITDDDPWRIAVQVADNAAGAGTPAAPAPQEPAADHGLIRDRVVQLVARMVADSPEPLVMGKAAHAAIQDAGPMITESRWLGHGTFKNLLLSAPDLPFQVVAFPLPGFLYDPARHASPVDRAAAADGLSELDGEMASLIRRIHQLTDAPKLTPRQYNVLFRVMAKELDRAPYNLMSTGKAVRDQCVERGEPIARQSITLVLRGLGYAGYRFWDPPHRADNLAHTYRGNLLNLLRQAQVTLSDDELRMLDEWLIGTPQEPSAEPPAGPSADADRAAADARRAPEPDYAAWADALLASADPRPSAGRADAPTPARAPEPEPFVWPPPDALRFEEHHPWVPRDGEPAPSADAIFAEPAESAEPVEIAESAESGASATSSATPDPAQPTASADDPAVGLPFDANAGHSVDADAASEASDDASDAPPTIDPQQPKDEDMTADEQPADAQPPVPADETHADAPRPIAPSDDADADAIPVELSDDHGPRGPDVVTAEWEMSNDPPAADPAEPAGLASAEPPPADRAFAEPAPADPSANAPADAQATPPAADSHADAPPAEPEIVPATWEPAEPVASDQPESGITDASAPTTASEPEPAPSAAEAPRDEPAPAADIVTPYWEPADAPPAAPEPPADPPVAPAPDAQGEPQLSDDVVTPQWEAVSGGETANTQPSAAPEPAAQMDAFPAQPPAANDAAPRDAQFEPIDAPPSDAASPDDAPKQGDAPPPSAPGGR